MRQQRTLAYRPEHDPPRQQALPKGGWGTAKMTKEGPEPDSLEWPPVRKVLLDTSVLLGHPEVLARAPRDIVLAVPSPVLIELAQRAKSVGPARIVLGMVQQALQSGVLVEEPLRVPVRSPLRGLSNVDMAILRAAYAHRSTGTAFASNDRALLEAAKAFATPAFTSREFLVWLAQRPADEVAVANQALVHFQVAVIVLGLLAAALGLTSAYFVARFGSELAVLLLASAGWAGFLFALPLGVLLFILRARKRFTYGAVETVFGMASTMLGAAQFQAPDPNMGAAGLAIAGGLYVIVRGLDNIDKAERNPLAAVFSKLSGTMA